MPTSVRRQSLRLVVERITVENGRVRIETVIPTNNHRGQLRARHPEQSEGSGEWGGVVYIRRTAGPPTPDTSSSASGGFLSMTHR